jgi:hypothetical protein
VEITRVRTHPDQSQFGGGTHFLCRDLVAGRREGLHRGTIADEPEGLGCGSHVPKLVSQRSDEGNDYAVGQGCLLADAAEGPGGG